MKSIGFQVASFLFGFVFAVHSAATPLPRALVVDQSRLGELSVNKLAANFVDRVIHDLPVAEHLERLRDLNPQALAAALDSQQKQLAFWINIYNGYTQHLLKTDPSLYLSDRSAFFKKAQIPIAGYTVSMDDIEHGVLRRGAVGFSMGFIRTLSFRKPFIRQFAVNSVDHRIHFALNCGARSCPPVLVYRADTVNAQLDDNSRYYLEQEVFFDRAQNKILVPALMRWFKADFGSTEDQLAMLQHYGVLPGGFEPDIDYQDYDWTLAIENYRTSP